MFNAKAVSYFAELADGNSKPDVISVVETHLMGTPLNRARRVMAKTGWRMFSTPAMPKKDRDAKVGIAAPSDSVAPTGS